MKTLIGSLVLSTLVVGTFAQTSAPVQRQTPPAMNTPPPTVNTPPPSGATPPPSGNTPPPSGATPPPAANSPPPGAPIQPPVGNNQNVQPGLNQSVQAGFQQPLNSQIFPIPTNSTAWPNGQNNIYNSGYGGFTNNAMITNSPPMGRTNYLPGRGYPTNLPVRPGIQRQY